jgi:two-component system response regulator
MKQPVNVLLVEDNPDDEELTLDALREHGVASTVHVARDGQEALDYLLGADAANPLPALVLLDLKLPKIDGLEVLRRIREDDRTKLVPVAILTSSDEENDLLESYANHANCYVRKPVEFEQFCDAARAMGLFWLLINEPPPAHA